MPGDGVRGGTCTHGQSDGLPCEATASDPTYPAPGGGFYSLDCMPDPVTNFTGLGISVSHSETTGSTSLAAGIPCDGAPGQMCPCAVCSGNSSLACTSDAQCALQSAGTCTSHGSGVPVQPNSCTGYACTADSEGEGECTTPSVTSYCDGLLEEDGRGILSCLDDATCQIGGDYGTCSVHEYRKCFGATIQATGVVDAHVPTTVATTCVPPTTSAAVNNVLGMPGPVRVRNEWYVTQVP